MPRAPRRGFHRAPGSATMARRPPAAGRPRVAIPASSPCDACDGRCCHVYVVPLTGEDAWRLASGSGIPMHRLVACAPQPGPTPAGFLLDPAGAVHELVLAAQ